MSSLRSSSVGVMRPPKPPCWRDFVVPSSARSVATTDVLDSVLDPSGRGLGTRSPVADLLEPTSSTSRPAALSAAPGARPGRLARRPRARIHRTRSEHVISPDDLPETIGGANYPSAIGGGGVAEEVRVSPSLSRSRARALTPDGHGQLYVEENNKRCQSWLASIEAAEPLDEVDYNALGELSHLSSNVHANRRHSNFDLGQDAETSMANEGHSNIEGGDYLSIGVGQAAAVEVEIPEETFQWYEDVMPSSRGYRDTRPRSPTDSDTCHVCKKSARGSGAVTTPTTAGSTSRKFTAPPLCGACTDCISCGSGEPLTSSAASDSNFHSARAINLEDRSKLCSCLHSSTSPKTSNKRSGTRKGLNSKTPGRFPPTDRSTSSPAVARSSGRLAHRSEGATVTETVARSGPSWQPVAVCSPGLSRRVRSVSRRRASHRNVFPDKDARL